MNDWTNDSPNVDCSARSQRSLDAIRRKKARKAAPFPSTSNVEKSEEEEEETEELEKDVDQQWRRELLRKLQEAKQEARNIEAGNFVSPRVRCPLCHRNGRNPPLMSPLMSQRMHSPVQAQQ